MLAVEQSKSKARAALLDRAFVASFDGERKPDRDRREGPISRCAGCRCFRNAGCTDGRQVPAGGARFGGASFL
jgi:hypothetical protein